MKIGRQEHRSSSISTSSADTIVVRGKDLCAELIGNVSFTDYFWFLLTGQMPNAQQRQVLDSTLVAIAEHGLVPSVQASRMTYAAAPESLQGAVAAGILGAGSVILGAAEDCAYLLVDARARVARDVVRELHDAGAHVPGFGHPLHKPLDPRAERIIELADDGPHLALAQELRGV